MSVQEWARAALTTKLVAAGNFDRAVRSAGFRRWFVRKLVDHFAGSISDAQVEPSVSGVIQKVYDIAQAKGDFTIKLLADATYSTGEKSRRRRRVETIYGAIAEEPGLADDAAYLDFVVARRYRTVARVEIWIEGERVMAYPSACPVNLDSECRFNAAAGVYWDSHPGPPKPGTSFLLSAQGKVDPLSALDHTWTRPPNARLISCDQLDDACLLNQFDCGHAVACCLIDSLQEAKDPGVFLVNVDQRKPDFIQITDPEIFGNTHALFDLEPGRFFTKADTDPHDLEVGDHVFIWNHPIYKTLVPEGDWLGEHAIVMDCGDRSLHNGFRFAGHGLSCWTKQVCSTLDEIRDALMKLYNYLLATPFVLGRRVLSDRRRRDTAHRTLANSYRYTDGFELPDYNTWTPGSTRPQTAGAGDWRVNFDPGDNAFRLFSFDDASQTTTEEYWFERTRPAADEIKLAAYLWALRYKDESGDDQYYSLFTGSGENVRQVLIPSSAWPDPPLRKRNLADYGGGLTVGIGTTRPTVDLGQDYRSALNTDGALGP